MYSGTCHLKILAPTRNQLHQQVRISMGKLWSMWSIDVNWMIHSFVSLSPAGRYFQGTPIKASPSTRTARNMNLDRSTALSNRIEAKHCEYTEELRGKVTKHDDEAKEIGIQSGRGKDECESQHGTMVRESTAKSAQVQGNSKTQK